MKKFILYILIIAWASVMISCGSLLNLMTEGVDVKSSNSEPIDHTIWTELLQKHVKGGKLSYRGIISDSVKFNSYLDDIKSSLPNDKKWTYEEQLAYWINAYNALTVELILQNYPVKSIKDIKGGVPFINSVWDIKFINIEGQEFDLNNIEHGILRDKFKDPRIHFAINCASISCPALKNEAYVADRIDDQLDEATIDFLSDDSKNSINLSEARLSKIFKWFKKDFTKDQSLVEFLNKFLDSPISKSTKISNLDYDWNLNDMVD